MCIFFYKTGGFVWELKPGPQTDSVGNSINLHPAQKPSSSAWSMLSGPLAIPRVPPGPVKELARKKKLKIGIKIKKKYFCKASSAWPRGFHTQAASETQTNHRGLGSSHSASAWAQLETLLQWRLCRLNTGQQVEEPSTRAWEESTPGLPGHFPEPHGFASGQGGQGKGRPASGKGAATTAASEDILCSCRDPWTQEVSVGQDFAGCSAVFVWVGLQASRCVCLLGWTLHCRAGDVPWMSLPQR